MWQIWLIAAGVFLVLEIFTMGFLVFWLSIGCLFAMLVSFVTDNLIVQTAVFVFSSGLLIFATKPLVKKFAVFAFSKAVTFYSPLPHHVPAGTPTLDPLIQNQMLFRLSYRHLLTRRFIFYSCTIKIVYCRFRLLFYNLSPVSDLNQRPAHY